MKAIKSVKHPTRKLYMLMELTPSVEVTGGPWFTDQELDVEFVEHLTNTCYKYITLKVNGNSPLPMSQGRKRHLHGLLVKAQG